MIRDKLIIFITGRLILEHPCNELRSSTAKLRRVAGLNPQLYAGETGEEVTVLILPKKARKHLGVWPCFDPKCFSAYSHTPRKSNFHYAQTDNSMTQV